MKSEEDDKDRGHGFLYLVVSVSGASVLAVELLGTRLLGPFYGVSLFLWSALITVTLAALSAGYALGGLMADRRCTFGRLAWILGIAGAWLCLIPFSRTPVVTALEPLGLRAAVLLAATVLFFPPLMLLGMVSPFAVKIRTSTLSEVGRSAGYLYAVSTMASVVAAILTGFVLIPVMGVFRLTLAIGALLLLTSAFTSLRTGRGFRAAFLAVLSIAAAAVASTSAGKPAAAGEAKILAFDQSPYGEISVVEFRKARFLLIDGSVHTFADAETGTNLFPYVNVLDLPRLMFKEAGRALLIGLGGGSAARNLSIHCWGVDAVEIDPVVSGYAREHFGLDEDDADVHLMDGRRFLTRTGERWDMIIVDAFGSGTVPFHLVTVEAVALMKLHLEENGILAVNMLTVGWRSEIVRSMAATLETSFAEVLALPVSEPPNALGNVVLLASDRPMELEWELDDPYSRFSVEYDMRHAWDNSFEPDTDGAVALTDERNPIELWGEEVNLVDRKRLRKYFEGSGLAWY